MERIPALQQLSQHIVRLLHWLDDNFASMFHTLGEQCPDAPVSWLGHNIVEKAFDVEFGVKS